MECTGWRLRARRHVRGTVVAPSLRESYPLRMRIVTISFRSTANGAVRGCIVACLAVTVSACAGSAAWPPEPVVDASPGWTQTGRASWYGPGFNGKQTASGEVYDMEAMTAAHRSLPFQTRVQVENLDNGTTTEVRINDRGPFIRGRIIDLSKAGARSVDMLGSGTARVRITVVGSENVITCSRLQLGAFEERANAVALADRVRQRRTQIVVETGEDGLHRVFAGPYPSRTAGERARDSLGGTLLGC